MASPGRPLPQASLRLPSNSMLALGIGFHSSLFLRDSLQLLIPLSTNFYRGSVLSLEGTSLEALLTSRLDKVPTPLPLL